ncbi:pentapeptide repeat-containing protein [Cellulomonas aerilata]|uniref:Pentapeptide repeat-containing protein n=1 Tax=Cellulomonas aerilata TaxID=515326 RepID=A0A512DCX4_9CELL|nr:hypothetical protein CAE01nite_20470 [Cellulomonas aerilata]
MPGPPIKARHWARYGIWSASAIAAVALLVLVIWLLPKWLTSDASGGNLKELDRLASVNAARSSLVFLVAGTAALATVIVAVRSHALDRSAHVTDRYSKAIEQLGSDKREVRVGAVFALERIARDSPLDQPAITEVLTAFVRESRPLVAAGAPASATARPAADVQAALTIIGRRRADVRERALDLRACDLRESDLPGANLRGALLSGSQFTGAGLEDARLEGAWLEDVDFTGAKLQAASLTRALLTGATFDGAEVYKMRVSASAVSEEQRRQMGAGWGDVVEV